MVPVDGGSDDPKESVKFVEGLAREGVLPHLPQIEKLGVALLGVSLLLGIYEALC